MKLIKYRVVGSYLDVRGSRKNLKCQSISSDQYVKWTVKN